MREGGGGGGGGGGVVREVGFEAAGEGEGAEGEGGVGEEEERVGGEGGEGRRRGLRGEVVAHGRGMVGGGEVDLPYPLRVADQDTPFCKTI